MAKIKTGGGRRGIRKQRWAVIVAAVVAAGMLLSSVIYYIGYMLPRDNLGAETGNFDPEAYRSHYRHEVETLEKYVDDHGATAKLLNDLASAYSMLISIQETFFDEPETLAQYRAAQVEACRALMEMEPEKAQYRIQYLYAAHKAGEDESLLREEAAATAALLREKPEPVFHFYLIDLLESMEEEEMLQEEIAWLEQYFADQAAADDLDNEGRYFYALLLAEHLEKKEAALEQLDLILEAEPEDSTLSQEAARYRDSLLPADETEGETDE